MEFLFGTAQSNATMSYSRDDFNHHSAGASRRCQHLGRSELKWFWLDEGILDERDARKLSTANFTDRIMLPCQVFHPLMSGCHPETKIISQGKSTKAIRALHGMLHG